MRWWVVIVAGLLILTGLVWFLQGVGVLPGSFMSGQSLWAVIGGGAMLLGALIIAFDARRRPP